MHIRKAQAQDIPAISRIFDDIHTAEEAGTVTIGWNRSIYPTRATAESALERDDLFVQESEGEIVGSAIINQIQVDVYADGAWQYPAEDAEVMVLHTLVISPRAAGKGFGSSFVAYYEALARARGCRVLRMDTNARNSTARALYRRLGYREADIVPCTFNGLANVQLVLLEKKLS